MFCVWLEGISSVLPQKVHKISLIHKHGSPPYLLSWSEEEWLWVLSQLLISGSQNVEEDCLLLFSETKTKVFLLRVCVWSASECIQALTLAFSPERWRKKGKGERRGQRRGWGLPYFLSHRYGFHWGENHGDNLTLLSPDPGVVCVFIVVSTAVLLELAK